jgi:hypothetical protein
MSDEVMEVNGGLNGGHDRKPAGMAVSEAQRGGPSLIEA